jgi:hypothetical protein
MNHICQRCQQQEQEQELQQELPAWQTKRCLFGQELGFK